MPPEAIAADQQGLRRRGEIRGAGEVRRPEGGLPGQPQGGRRPTRRCERGRFDRDLDPVRHRRRPRSRRRSSTSPRPRAVNVAYTGSGWLQGPTSSEATGPHRNAVDASAVSLWTPHHRILHRTADFSMRGRMDYLLAVVYAPRASWSSSSWRMPRDLQGWPAYAGPGVVTGLARPRASSAWPWRCSLRALQRGRRTRSPSCAQGRRCVSRGCGDAAARADARDHASAYLLSCSARNIPYWLTTGGYLAGRPCASSAPDRGGGSS
ncbi:MAG: hypothetical protein MZV64_70840 [Ignavibacteriales bacterium]|nr:hypothetical protein [Ignavibacteriales bacterium]